MSLGFLGRRGDRHGHRFSEERAYLVVGVWGPWDIPGTRLSQPEAQRGSWVKRVLDKTTRAEDGGSLAGAFGRQGGRARPGRSTGAHSTGGAVKENGLRCVD